jgi:hypothetical protein
MNIKATLGWTSAFFNGTRAQAVIGDGSITTATIPAPVSANTPLTLKASPTSTAAVGPSQASVQRSINTSGTAPAITATNVASEILNSSATSPSAAGSDEWRCGIR